MSRLSQTPEDFVAHAQLYVFRSDPAILPPRPISVFSSVTGALIMEITYGLNIESHEDKFLQTAEHAMEYIEKIMVPGAFLVDTFPIRSFGL
jgi:hypothetical protein